MGNSNMRDTENIGDKGNTGNNENTVNFGNSICVIIVSNKQLPVGFSYFFLRQLC